MSKVVAAMEPQAVPPRSEPGLPPPENKRFYPALDGLRAVAVLLVFFHHYRLRASTWLEWGWVGVDVFFVLSGFLITGILFDSRNSRNRYTSFYARRTLRIFPLYYAVWLVFVLLTPLLKLRWSPRWILWPFYLGNYTHLIERSAAQQSTSDWLYIGSTHMQHIFGSFFSFGHLWSLSVEEQFYLIWPLILFRIADRRRLLRFCGAIIFAEPLIRALAVLFAPAAWIARELLYRSTPFRCDALLIGAAIALLLRGRKVEWLFRYCWSIFF